MSKQHCVVCEGRHTVESLVWLQLQAVPERHPVCSAHHPILEECLRETAKVRTPPVVVNCAGLRVGAAPRESC